MSIAERIHDDLKIAQKQRNRTVVSTLRLLSAALHNDAIAKRSELTEPDVIRVVQREAKRRTEAIESYTKAGSAERVAQETAELEVLKRYLPEQLDATAVEAAVRAAIAEADAAGPQDFGKVMKPVMQQLQGKADGKLVQATVKRLLQEPGS